ncbi:hypothetical protein IE4771_CH01116 [Rhizobium etli bv. mimosae str. IE4771]|uniref:Uncharacterized protein n=1 Tax=Rhizobium etli bv. mimosae str. IE4771 TaxID=1432050 RepID=A0A060HXE6_RHIET|nr:hypothetical protein IE4771_CH01116 [Rhizobium sp. IE4771]
MRKAGSIAASTMIDLCSEIVLTREDAIRLSVREWMEKNTYLPVHELDEDGDVDGSA